MFYHLEGWRIVQLIAKTRIVPEEFNDYLDDLHREITPEELIVPYGPLPNISRPLGKFAEDSLVLDSRFFVGSWPPGPTLAIDPTDSRLPPFPAARPQDTYMVGWLTDKHLKIVRPGEQEEFKDYLPFDVYVTESLPRTPSSEDEVRRVLQLYELFRAKNYLQLVNDPDYFLFIRWYEAWIKQLGGVERGEIEELLAELEDEAKGSLTPARSGWTLDRVNRLNERFLQMAHQNPEKAKELDEKYRIFDRITALTAGQLRLPREISEG